MLSRTLRFLLGLSLMACSQGAEPIDAIWGKQACGSCRMLVSDPLYAAQVVDARGERLFFDDIGCLDAYLSAHPEPAPRGVWVHSGLRWVTAESARYTTGAATPMAYGIATQDRGPLDFAAARHAAAVHREEASR